MKRQDRFPDTTTFHFYNANPKGRFTTDCVIRAISTATQIAYAETVRTLAEWQIRTGFDDGDASCYGKMLEADGWTKQRQPRKPDGKKYTGSEFCDWLIKTGEWKRHRRIIAHLGGNHVVAIIDGRVWDTWDSTDGCIGNYWTK